MNYKILAASVAATGTLIAFGLIEANRSADEATRQVSYSVTAADMREVSPDRPMAGNFSSQGIAPPASVRNAPSRSGTQASTVAPADLGLSDSAVSIATAMVGMPQIAYRFGYGFRVPANSMKALQDRHADQCEAKGPLVCRILAMEQSDGAQGSGRGELRLAVVSERAREFGKELAASADKAEGELVSSSIEGEDLSKQIVDTEARLRARSLLRDRLMDVLRSRKGTVAELVEAERGVAQVNEEIDQATSWLSEMKGRVRYSQMQIAYESAGPVAVLQESGGFMEPVRKAIGSIGGILGAFAAFFILLVTVILPLGMAIMGGAWLWRRASGRPISAILKPAGPSVLASD